MHSPAPASATRRDALRHVAARRWRIALALTGAMLVTYFGFILLIAFEKERMGALIAPGLSLGILLGALVIVVAFGLTAIYVAWANRRYDAALARIAVQKEPPS
jgi:uncharacterized membrane protein (DUF485 family)